MKPKALLCALVVLALAAPAAFAATAKVRSVSVPRTATAGMPVDVSVKIARKGHARSPKLAFYLSSDAKRDSHDVRLKKAAGRPRIPAGQALGSYRLIACAGKSCRASRPIQVTKTPVGTRELVQSAVAAGKLSPEQGLVYRVFAAFGDGRLPAAYAGDDAAPEDTIMREVVDSWPQLSAKQRSQLQPFLTPPAAKGSWAADGASASASAAPGPQPTCRSSRFAGGGWRSIAEKDGHVRIWWRAADRSRFATQARSLLKEADEKIWPRLWDVFGRDALPDGGEQCFHGPDDKLDVYLTRNGEADAKAVTISYPGSCSAGPAYVVFNAGWSAPTRWELAHELTHAFQYAFPISGRCWSWDKFDEAVATWGGQYIYPHDDQEHQYTWLTKEPSTPLADASYDGWIFPYALEQLVGPGVMQRIYEQGATHQAMNAIDAGVPGGLAKVYPEFAKLAWNHDPVKPSFWEWDGFDPVPEDVGGEIVPEQVNPGATGQQELDLTQPQKPLSRAYKHLKFGPGVTEVSVAVPYDQNLHVEALMKLRNGSVKTQDLSRRKITAFCPEASGERIDEMVLVASNTSTYRQMAQDKPVRVVGTNLGCSQYVGSLTGAQYYKTNSADTTESWTGSNLVFKRSSTGVAYDANLSYKLVGGTVTWSYGGVNQGCNYNAGPVTFQIAPDGSMGSLQALAWNIYSDKPVRPYYGFGWNLPAVPVTITCPGGHTSTTTMRPHEFLKTGDPTTKPDVPGNGVLEGNWTNEEHSGGAYHETYKWHLEARP
jgi:hypothetical protein